MNTKPYAKNQVDPAVKRRRVINALQAVLERVGLEADTEDADSLDDADALLRALDDLMAPARAARIQERARLKRERGTQRQRENLLAEAERARIMNIAPSNEVLLDELQKARAAGDTDRARRLEAMINGLIPPGEVRAPAPVVEPSKEALAKAEKHRLATPRKVEPKPLDAETAKAVERVRALNRAHRQGRTPTAPAALAPEEDD